MPITSIRLQNFKGFLNATLPLKPLTVILGPNSAGKSCFGQALVALSKSNERLGIPSLAFDDNFSINFGGYADLVNSNRKGKPIFIDIGLGNHIIRLGFGPGNEKAGIGELDLIYESTLTAPEISTEGTSQIISTEELSRNSKLEWKISPSSPVDETLESLNVNYRGIVIDSASKLTGTGVAVNDVVPNIKQKSEVLASILRGISYIRPDRIPPARKRLIQPGKTKIDDVGNGIESFIHEFKNVDFDCFFFPKPSPDKEENKKILFEYSQTSTKKRRLIKILNQWLDILGLASFFDIKVLDDGKYIQAVVSPINQSGFRPLTDVGFGVSQVLPILAKGITIKINDWLIVEQPEAQLHPKPQAGLADFFCSMVKCGRNVIVETHSVELFHRLRLRASMDDDLAQKIGVYFLDQPENGTCCEPFPIPLDEDEELSWPKGFLPEGINKELEILAVRLAREESN